MEYYTVMKKRKGGRPLCPDLERQVNVVLNGKRDHRNDMLPLMYASSQTGISIFLYLHKETGKRQKNLTRIAVYAGGKENETVGFQAWWRTRFTVNL